jgi:uncharacterized metal-binding protein YceD (DUF177 family)
MRRFFGALLIQRDNIYVDCQTCAESTLYLHRCLHPGFPDIDIPVTVVYDYRGLQAQEME